MFDTCVAAVLFILFLFLGIAPLMATMKEDQRVEKMAGQVEGRVIKTDTPGSFGWHYMIVLPDGRVWDDPEHTEPPTAK